MTTKYLIRLDDACPTMNHQKWDNIEVLLDSYGIKPMVGVIPHNEDPDQIQDSEDPNFWIKIKSWEQKGWTIAMHGYNHIYCSDKGKKGLNPMWKESEFVGLTIEQQREKIRKGLAVMLKYSIKPKYFFAPSHTFDENTLVALREESDIRIISDTIATRPYRYGGFVFIPQFSGSCREMKIRGLYTFCMHPNLMSEGAFEQTARFLQRHCDEFISFSDIDIDKIGSKNFFDKILGFGYFTARKIRRLIYWK